MNRPNQSHADVLILDKDPALRDNLERVVLHAGYSAASAATARDAVTAVEHHAVRLIICERGFQDNADFMTALRQQALPVPVIVISEEQSVDTVVEAVKNGAADFLAKPVDSALLQKLITEYLPKLPIADQLVAHDPLTQQVRNLAQRVSHTDATVLVCGPSGVGKEVISRYIHCHSPRADHPFIAVNCAAIPENMLEAMLFGYEKGAYTGAVNNHIGKFEQAQGGTLLLDEISEMDLALQAKLLRVLQEKELERLGGRRTIRLDVRVLATTNRDLRDAVKRGEFREDLFYRLNVFPLHIPPLADRPRDILPLARHFLSQHSRTDSDTLSVKAQQKLLSHTWPGNVRELDNVVQRALILQSDRIIHDHDIYFEMPDVVLSTLAESDQEQKLSEHLRLEEKRQIQHAIVQGGSKKEAAAILGISPRTLRYKMARLREAEMGV